MTALTATTTLINDPAYPWSLSTVGLPALALVAVLLAVLTFWTYLGVPGANVRRVLVVLGLRLLALVLACLAVLRPSLAFRDELHVPSILLIACDASESMTNKDEYSDQTRWQALLRTLRDCQPILDKLRSEYHINIIFYQFGADVGEFNPQGGADGKRTDFGLLLDRLYKDHGHERYLRGLIILSDGANNGTRFPEFTLASQWRDLPCPLYTVGFGNPLTADKQNDIALVEINPEPAPVPTKGELTVKATLEAPGFENAVVRLMLLLDDKEVASQDVKLGSKPTNEVKIKCSAPPTPGEVKVTLKVQPLAGELTDVNNEISTYLTVTREGISVLLVDKARYPEPQFIARALASDKRIRLYDVTFRNSREGAAPGQIDLFQFDKQHYDVIILGDVTPGQVESGNTQAFSTIRKLVTDKGTGLLLMGGYNSFSTAWKNTRDIAELMPVRMDAGEQVEKPVHMAATEVGLRRFLLRLDDNLVKNEQIWKGLPDLTGMSRLGSLKDGVTVYARAGDPVAGEPILVGQQVDKGRTLAFAGDTTWQWVRDPDGQRNHARFWKQLVLYLARQDEAEGSVRVRPTTRRLGAGNLLGFNVSLHDKNGDEVKDARFEVQIVNPQDVKTTVQTVREKTEERGKFWKTEAPGEYRILVRGWGKDAEGKAVDENNFKTPTRFVVFQDTAEMATRAANHDFLKTLAGTGGGRFLKAEELGKFLQDLAAQPLPQSKPKASLWPDWRRNALSGFLWGFFLLFVALLCLEWFLRRRWGMV